jgi:hypothetical protein
MNLGFITTSNLFSSNFTLIMQNEGYWNEYDEFINNTTENTFELVGSIEPVKGINRSNDVSGARSHQTISITVNANHVIRALHQGSSPSGGDLVIVNNKKYKVKEVKDYSQHNFIDIIAIRINGEND